MTSSRRRFPPPWTIEEFDTRAELLGTSQRSPWGVHLLLGGV
jgi:hypothetical protein